MAKQADIPPEPSRVDVDAMQSWMAAAQAALNGIRSNPAYAGLDSEQIAAMAAADADALIERRDNGPEATD